MTAKQLSFPPPQPRRVVDKHPESKAAPLKRLTHCCACNRETWHVWNVGHDWVCGCGEIRHENVWEGRL